MAIAAHTDSWRFSNSERESHRSTSSGRGPRITRTSSTFRAAPMDVMPGKRAALFSVEQTLGSPAESLTLPTVSEEFANTLTHGIGMVLSLSGFHLPTKEADKSR